MRKATEKIHTNMWTNKTCMNIIVCLLASIITIFLIQNYVSVIFFPFVCVWYFVVQCGTFLFSSNTVMLLIKGITERAYENVLIQATSVRGDCHCEAWKEICTEHFWWKCLSWMLRRFFCFLQSLTSLILTELIQIQYIFRLLIS